MCAWSTCRVVWRMSNSVRSTCCSSRRRAWQSSSGRTPTWAAPAAGRPIGRMAEVSEIAAAIVFLCSERASYVAGAAWSVDGGTVQVIL